MAVESGFLFPGVFFSAPGGLGNQGGEPRDPGWSLRDQLLIPERARVVKVRDIKREDLPYVLRWSSNPEVRKHLEPAPKLPEDWNDSEQVGEALQGLVAYYNNYGEHNKIRSLISMNPFGEPVAVSTIRLRGDPYVPSGSGKVAVERVIVDPDVQNYKVGTTHMATTIEYAFAKGAREILLWVMTDRLASPYEKNLEFFRKFGFQAVPAYPHWREYAKRRQIKEYSDRDAQWFYLKPEWYQARKEIDPTLKSCGRIHIEKQGRAI